MQEQLLDNDLQPTKRRRDLLPVWIKVFIWIFMIFTLLVPVGLVFGLLGQNFNLALYGLETWQPVSVIGIFIMLLFALKGIVAFGLWTEKEWAANLALVDGILGVVVCLFVMVALPLISNGFRVSFRLELLFLIPYLVKIWRIKPTWITAQS